MNIDQALGRIRAVREAASHRHAATDAFVSGCPKCAAGVDAGLVLSGATDALALLVVELGRLAAGYERWEADLIMCRRAWQGGLAPLPSLTDELYDGLMELQAERNAVLAALLAFAETLGATHDRE